MAAVLVACCAGAFAQDAAAGDTVVLYVDDDAPPGGNGFSWDSAHRTLQDALMFAHSFGADEIRIAQGVYKPDQGGGQTPGDRNATFSIPSGLALRGGYAGLTGDDPDARDWKKFESALSGDLLGNDGPPGSLKNLEDNSFHVMTAHSAQDVIVEGLTILAGRGVLGLQPVRGGGLLAIDAQLAVDHCAVVRCSALEAGGISATTSHLTIRHTQFIQNSALNLGAVGLRSSTVTLEQCHFSNNISGGSFGGGALGTMQNSNSDPASTCIVTSCVFIANRAIKPGLGGAIRRGANGKVEISSSHFESNRGDEGGAIAGGVVSTDCTFANNEAVYGGAVLGGGDYTRCNFVDGFASAEGAGIDGSGTFIDCTFQNNFAQWGGGAGIIGFGAFINCRFVENDGWFDGGGGARVVGPSTFVNCLFAQNLSRDPGGAIRVVAGQHATLINSTITENNVLTSTGGVSVGGSATIINSVIFGNALGDLAGSADVTYSCIGGGWPGLGNIAVDPQFVNSADDDFRLQSTSPCIDAADNTAMPPDTFDLDDDGDTAEPLPIDLDGLPRFRNNPASPNVGVPSIPGLPIVDMGAFEHQPLIPADVNGDFCVNVVDLLAVINAWGPCQPPETCKADIAPSGGDGVVDRFDLFHVVISWGCY